MKTIIAAAVGGLLLAASNAAGAERASADVSCKESEKKLVFDCSIMLSGRTSKQPLSGAKIKISADMPSMPMAHNVKPIAAEPAGKPGMYRVRIPLEMYGEWALKLRIEGPARDIVVRKLRFGTEAAGEMKHQGHDAPKMDKMAPGGHKQ